MVIYVLVLSLLCLCGVCIALAEAARDRETALEELRKKLASQYDEERWKLSETHLGEISKLNALLTDKSAELDIATEELKRLRSAVAESEQGLGSATGQVEKLRRQLGQLQGEISSTKTQLEGSKRENDQLKVWNILYKCPVVNCICVYLKVMLESLKQQHREMEKSHCEELKRTKDELTQQLEEKWKERLKYV